MIPTPPPDPFAVTIFAPPEILVSSRQEFAHRIVDALLAGHDVIIDLSSTGYIDSAALGMLLRVTREGKEGGRHVCLRGCTPELLELFAVARLFDKLKICA